MRKMIALLLFDFGSFLIILGSYTQGDTEQHREYLKWQNRVERAALKAAFEKMKGQKDDNTIHT